MNLSSRVKETQTSVTLKMNEKVQTLVQSGKHIYNMTNGQLPFKPSGEFISALTKQTNFLKSYQYSPISGFAKLREKFLVHHSELRKTNLMDSPVEMDCIISNGSKHSLYNAFGALINPGDEVILLTPYWVSYPEIIKFWGGVPVVVQSHAFDAYTPSFIEIEKKMSAKTKAIVINSPNNPAGIHYSETWMKEFGEFLKKHRDLVVVSDEVYSDICYFDPKPTYFYQYDNELLAQTVIIHGISKSYASTGLRVGYCIADSRLIKAMGRIQSQTTSGPNSLVQRALIEFDFNQLENFLDPVKEHLRECAQIVREAFRDANLPHCFYQTHSAFYYLLDFTRMPFFSDYSENEDNSEKIVDQILLDTGVALVPGGAFGYPNSARMSMTLELSVFREAIEKLVNYLAKRS